MHIAIIMDGNGRWATRRLLPRTAGHRAGAKAVNDIVEAAARRDVSTLSLYAFSAANWERPKSEVSALLRLLQRYLLTQTRRCLEQSIRINVIGRRDRLSPALRRAIEHSERATAECSRMCLRIAVDYSAQYSLMEAARRSLAGTPGGAPALSALAAPHEPTPQGTPHDGTPHSSAARDRAQFLANLAAVDHSVDAPPEVDLLIRTGGEQRLSDFLLWECAYAELYFSQTLWPDFDAAALDAALADYSRRERRFGQISAAPARAGLG
jgi:undecaprenyl diphosphate synthase